MLDEEEQKKEDIFIVKETGKFMINDLELMQTLKASKKRSKIEATKDSDESSVGDNVSESSSDTDEDELKN
jgi:hypothetical protein